MTPDEFVAATGIPIEAKQTAENQNLRLVTITVKSFTTLVQLHDKEKGTVEHKLFRSYGPHKLDKKQLVLLLKNAQQQYNPNVL